MAIQHEAARGDENFPVASRLLPKGARRDILALYDFARGADDIADHTGMSADARYEALAAIQTALDQHQKNRLPPWAVAYYERVQQGFLPAQYGEALLAAFMQDCRKSRYANLQELLDYCQLSAAPVGQAVLVLCGEQEADMQAADALCAVLQLTNHLQDMKADYLQLDRVYVPQDWLREVQVAESELAADGLSDPLRQVIDRLLDACDRLLLQAKPLTRSIRSRRLRVELGCIECVAKRLVAKLRRHDPLAGRVALSSWDRAMCLLGGVRRL